MSTCRRSQARRRYGLLLVSSLYLALTSTLLADGKRELFASDGYRVDAFRAPVPHCVPDARTVNTAQVRQLLASKDAAPVLVDVLPSPPRPKGLSPTTLWLPQPRHNIPGSVWLPNVGYGRLSAQLDSYFRSHLNRLTDGNMSRAIVIYCLADCWMSWNAARRAASYGYEKVLWYPAGTDGWSAARYPLAISTPEPLE